MPCGRVSRVLFWYWLRKGPCTSGLQRLENELPCYLSDTGTLSAERPSKRTRAVVDEALDPSNELGVVEGVKELGTEFQLHPFGQPHILQQGQVPVVESWPKKEPPAGVPLLPDRFVTEQRGVEIGVDEDAGAVEVLISRITVNVDPVMDDIAGDPVGLIGGTGLR